MFTLQNACVVLPCNQGRCEVPLILITGLTGFDGIEDKYDEYECLNINGNVNNIVDYTHVA